MNYAKLDATTKFRNREEKLKIAKSLGYKYISECICELYKTHSLVTTGEIIGINYSSVLFLLKKWKVKRRDKWDHCFGRVYYGYHKGRENPDLA